MCVCVCVCAKFFCAKIVTWLIVVKEGTNTLIFYIFDMVLNVVLNLVLHSISYIQVIVVRNCKLEIWRVNELD